MDEPHHLGNGRTRRLCGGNGETTIPAAYRNPLVYLRDSRKPSLGGDGGEMLDMNKNDIFTTS